MEGAKEEYLFEFFKNLPDLKNCCFGGGTLLRFQGLRCIRFSIQSAASNVFALFAAKAVVTDWLSVQIIVCSFPNPFLKQVFTQFSVPTSLLETR